MTRDSVGPQVPDGFRLDPGGKLMLAIADIVVGDRHRIDVGDIEKLKNSINEVGQLQPVVVTAGRKLVAGYRRIEALTRLGMDEAEVTIAANVDDALSELVAERDENTCRKEFTKLEASALAKAIREIEAPKAEERRRRGKKNDGPAPNLGEGGRTNAKIAKVTGIKPETQRKIDKIVDLAFDESAPEMVRAAALSGYETMKANDKAAVHPLYQAVIAAEKAANSAEPDAAKAGGEVVGESAGVRACITTLIAEAEADVAKLGEKLDQLYADDRFSKASNVRTLGEAIGLLVVAYENVTATAIVEGKDDE